MQYFNFVSFGSVLDKKKKKKLPVLFWSEGVRKKKGREGITKHCGFGFCLGGK